MHHKRKSMPELFDQNFYTQTEVVTLAKRLLGCRIVSFAGGEKTVGIITETEAYKAPEDKASHAWNNRRTSRTETMFHKGGVAYIYLCYGIHHLFNVVAGPENTAHAVLIRAVAPVEGVDVMMKRRGLSKGTSNLTNGPGKWTQAMGITTALDGVRLFDRDSPIQLFAGPPTDASAIIAGPRVGIDYAEEWASVPWRFRVNRGERSVR